jgi:hypothetical protein
VLRSQLKQRRSCQKDALREGYDRVDPRRVGPRTARLCAELTQAVDVNDRV